MVEGLDDEHVIERITRENLFQFPTEKSIRKLARACISRLKAMGDDALIQAIVL